MDERRLFSAADEEAIRAAAADAEQRSAGEVVPWIAEACDSYPEAGWKAAALGALLGLVLGAGAQLAGGTWGGALWVALAALAGGAAGLALGQLPAAKRLLVDDEVVEHRVRTAAEAAFVKGEGFATRERTGILVFLALLERRVVVLGDAGINARVQPEEWQAIVDEIVAGVRQSPPGAGPAGGGQSRGPLVF